MKRMTNLYTIYFASRYYPFEGTHKRQVFAPNKKWIRDNFHSIVGTDEYRLIKSEQVK